MLSKETTEPDVVILRKLVESFGSGRSTEFDEKVFERNYCEYSMRIVKVSERKIANILHLEEVNRRFRGFENSIVITGKNLYEQIKSVLPPPIPEYEKNSLCLALSHIVLDDVRFTKEVVPEGTDWLSATLLTIHQCGQFANVKIKWLPTIWENYLDNKKWQILQQIRKLVLSKVSANTLQVTMKRAVQEILEIASEDLLANKITDKWLNEIEHIEPNRFPTKEIRNQLQKEVVQELKNMRRPTVDDSYLTLRPDALAPTKYYSLIMRLRGQFSILRNRRFVELCKGLADCTEIGRPTVQEIAEKFNEPWKKAFEFYKMIQYILREQVLLSLPKLGLRLRFLVAHKRRTALPRNALVASMSIGQTSRGVTVHAEPVDCRGPTIKTANISQFVVEEEIISMRLDLFDQKKGTWKQPWTRPDKSPSISLALRRATGQPKEEKTFWPTQRQVDLISLLWGTEILRRQRAWLLRAIKFPSISFISALKTILDEKLITILYLPALEFCQLPEALFLATKNSSTKECQKIADWLMRLVPFSRIIMSGAKSEEKCLVAELRLPARASSVVRAIIMERLKKTTTEIEVERINRRRTYRLTALNKIYDGKKKKWQSPWRS